MEWKFVGVETKEKIALFFCDVDESTRDFYGDDLHGLRSNGYSDSGLNKFNGNGTGDGARYKYLESYVDETMYYCYGDKHGSGSGHGYTNGYTGDGESSE
jgi:hypothetical protein